MEHTHILQKPLFLAQRMKVMQGEEVGIVELEGQSLQVLGNLSDRLFLFQGERLLTRQEFCILLMVVFLNALLHRLIKPYF